MGRCFCPDLIRISEICSILNDRGVDRILHIAAMVRDAPQAFEIRFVLGEKEFVRAFAMQLVGAERRMRCVVDFAVPCSPTQTRMG